MSRLFGIVFALALFASAAHSEEDRSAYLKATARLTEQLNETISKRVDLRAPAPPAKRDEAAEDVAPNGRQASR
jgi:hypothetical protein